MSKGTIVVNRGTRTYNLIAGPGGEKRSLPPGGSIELLDEKEAAHMLRYHDIRDIKDAAPQTAARIKAHEAEIERLKAENARLQKAAKTAGTGDSVEELNEATAGTGFAGPGGPGPLGSQPKLEETDPTHQETTESEKAAEKADKANKQSTGSRRR